MHIICFEEFLKDMAEEGLKEAVGKNSGKVCTLCEVHSYLKNVQPMNCTLYL